MSAMGGKRALAHLCLGHDAADYPRSQDFTRACELAAENGFDVCEAKYDGTNFGCWSVEVARKGMRPRMLLWEARDYWVSVITRDADGEWQNEWHVKEPTRDTPREVFARLLSLTE